MQNDPTSELRFLRDLGFTHLDLRPPARNTAALVTSNSIAENADPVPFAQDAARFEDGPATAEITGATDLDGLRILSAACQRCRLAGSRTQVVYGTGNPNADLMFVGEAPGRDEDLQGAPFVGRAGQLLTDIIKAMRLTREDVYISNVVKCRPPENRNPEPDELDACRPYIRRQIDFIKPRVVVTLGRFGLQSLTGRAYSISQIRGQWLDLDGIKLMPTYHPAYLLRTPSAKKDVWNDMKLVMTELGITS